MAFTDVEKGMAKRTLKHYCSWWNELRYDEIHNKPYFIGKRTKDSSTEILFPIDCYKTMTFNELKTCIVDSGATSVNLAVYSSDSTVVLYKGELGLKPPSHLKESETTISDNPNVAAECTGSSNERKKDTDSNSLLTGSAYTEQIETGSTSDCLQIDLQPADDSELSETENDDSEDSNSGDKSEAVCP